MEETCLKFIFTGCAAFVLQSRTPSSGLALSGRSPNKHLFSLLSAFLCGVSQSLWKLNCGRGGFSSISIIRTVMFCAMWKFYSQNTLKGFDRLIQSRLSPKISFHSTMCSGISKTASNDRNVEGENSCQSIEIYWNSKLALLIIFLCCVEPLARKDVNDWKGCNYLSKQKQ